jgi:hypothetical protein
MHTGKCPHCEKVIDRVHAESIDVCDHAQQPAWPGTSFFCLHCETVLSVGFDLLPLLEKAVSGAVVKIQRR